MAINGLYTYDNPNIGPSATTTTSPVANNTNPSLTQDQLNQLHNLYTSASSGSQNLNFGNPNVNYGTVGIEHTGEDGNYYNPNSLIQYDPNHMDPGDAFYYIDPNTGQVTGQNAWSSGEDHGLGALTVAGFALGANLLFGNPAFGLDGMIGAGAGVDPSLAVQGNSINALDAATGVPYGSEAAAGASGAGSGSSLYSLGGNAGQGLQVGTGSGLNLGATTGGPGISAGLGDGLTLANTTPGLTEMGGAGGLSAATGGNALLEGAGLTSGLANGTGTALTGSVLDGTYTMADGTLMPGYTSTGVPITPSGGTPTPSGSTSSTPPGGGTPSNTGGSTGGTSGGGLGLGDIMGLLTGIYGMNQQNQASNDMLNYLRSRQQMNDNMYAPGSPEYNALWDEMSRKDAAAGRNSQYGPRSVDLAARVAQLKMDANTRMTTGIGNMMANAINQRAMAGSNVTSMLPALLNSAGGTGSQLNLSSLTNFLSRMYNGQDVGDPSTWDWTGATPSPGTGYDTSDPSYIPWEDGAGYDGPIY